MRRNSSAGKRKAASIRSNNKFGMPENLKKDTCAYVDGVVSLSCRGKYIVQLENGMEAVATASTLDHHKKITIIVGDKVTIEIPMMSLPSNSEVEAFQKAGKPVRINGRIRWVLPSKSLVGN